MPLGEKAWEFKGRATGVTVKSTGLEGVTLEINMVGERKGFGRFPDGRDVATVTTVVGPAGMSTFTAHGVFTTKDGERIIFKDSGATKPGESGGRRVAGILSSMTTSQKYSWMNSAVMFEEAESTPDQEFKATLYEWK